MDAGGGGDGVRPESGSDSFYKGVGRLWSSAACVAEGRETERNAEQCPELTGRFYGELQSDGRGFVDSIIFVRKKIKIIEKE